MSAPPHLAAIAPSAASGDPWRIVPYDDMVFSPINVDWACLMRARTLQNTAELDIGSALTHLPLIDLPQRLGCGDVPLWDRWIAHPTLDAYWRAARRHRRTSPRSGRRCCQIAGWHDDSRGPIDYTDALLKVPNHPFVRLVMGPRRAQGRRLRHRRLRSAVARTTRDVFSSAGSTTICSARTTASTREPPFDVFVFGDNTWRKEAAWPIARAVPTNWYVSSGGTREHERRQRHARHDAADGRGGRHASPTIRRTRRRS